MGSPRNKIRRWIHFLFSKRLNVSLYIILPVVFGLTAFASGFIALILVEHFLVNPATGPGITIAHLTREALQYIRLEVLGFTLLGALTGWGVAYAILNPLKHWLIQAKQVAEGTSQKLKTRPLNELGPMGQDLRQMVSSLQKNLIDSVAWGWVLISKTGHIAGINPGAEAILGVKSQDLLGQPFNILARSIKMDGDLIDFLSQTLTRQETFSRNRLDIVMSDGREVALSLSTTVLHDAEGNTLGVAATFKDLTRSDEITEQMQRTDKLAAMGSLAACVAHEVRNPLGAIKGLTQLMHESFEEGNTHRTYTQTMIREIDRLNEVVTNLLEFSQTPSHGMEERSINELVDQALLLARVDGRPKEIVLEKNLGENLPLVKVEPQKMVQAFLNLLLNAIQAVETGGVIRVSTQKIPEASGQSEDLRIEIANTGQPLDPAVADRLFDPFFTTKKDGTGLGLAICNQIMNHHKGKLSVHHEQGFTFFRMDLQSARIGDAQDTVQTKL